MFSFKDWFKTFAMLLIFTSIAYLFYVVTDNTLNIAIVYILYVLIVSRLTTGYIYGIIASVFGVVGVNYLFTYPFGQLNFTLSGYPITFMGMLCISLITSALTSHVKEQARIASSREEAMNQLNEVNKKLILADSMSHIINLTLDFTMNFTHSSVIFYEKDPISGHCPSMKLINDRDQNVLLSSLEQATAHQAYKTEVCILPHIDTNDSACIYLPIISHDITWGILGIYHPENPRLNPDTLRFLNLMLPQVSLAFERQALSDDHQLLAIETEKEKTRANLLRAVSHDLRTPLTGMIGSSSAYLENTSFLSEVEKHDLVSQIYEDANWLLHMVENLLAVTRIQQETARVIKNLEPLEEVISESLVRIKKRYTGITIKVSIPDELIMVPMDATLIEQVIINLLENAINHSGSTEPISLKAIKDKDYIKVQVIDQGVGIPADKLNSLFDGGSLSANNSSDTSKGMGIGLSICKTIITAHGGTITGGNLKKGAIFTFTLPLEGDVSNE